MELHHPITRKLRDLGGQTYRQTDRYPLCYTKGLVFVKIEPTHDYSKHRLVKILPSPVINVGGFNFHKN